MALDFLKLFKVVVVVGGSSSSSSSMEQVQKEVVIQDEESVFSQCLEGKELLMNIAENKGLCFSCFRSSSRS
jgi:hypothetical protein